MSEPKYIVSEGVSDKLIKVGIGAVLFYFGKKFLKKQATDNADSQIDTNPAAGQARSLNAAMNPSGFDWMRSFDTTNSGAIYSIAPQITSLDDVKKFYSAQTSGRVLHEDLINELGADGYDKFLALATKGKSGSPKYSTTRKDILANAWVITKADANIRTTPKKEGFFSTSFNIVKTIPTGNAIGLTTGKYAYDEPNDVTFIEFWTFETKDVAQKVKHYFYVALSQVELLTVTQKAQREKTGKIPYAFLEGLSGFGEPAQTFVVSLRMTTIYDEQFKPLINAPQNVILGFALLTLDTKKEIFLKIKTIQGKIRWVKEKDTRLQNRS